METVNEQVYIVGSVALIPFPAISYATSLT